MRGFLYPNDTDCQQGKTLANTLSNAHALEEKNRATRSEGFSVRLSACFFHQGPGSCCCAVVQYRDVFAKLHFRWMLRFQSDTLWWAFEENSKCKRFSYNKFEFILSFRSLKTFSIIFGFRKTKFKLLLSIYFILILSFNNNYAFIKYVKNTLTLKILKVFSLLIYLELFMRSVISEIHND